MIGKATLHEDFTTAHAALLPNRPIFFAGILNSPCYNAFYPVGFRQTLHALHDPAINLVQWFAHIKVDLTDIADRRNFTAKPFLGFHVRKTSHWVSLVSDFVGTVLNPSRFIKTLQKPSGHLLYPKNSPQSGFVVWALNQHLS